MDKRNRILVKNPSFYILRLPSPHASYKFQMDEFKGNLSASDPTVDMFIKQTGELSSVKVLKENGWKRIQSYFFFDKRTGKTLRILQGLKKIRPF